VDAVALDLDAVLADTRPLWRDWVEDAARRTRVELDLPDDRAEAATRLDESLGDWRPLLERFAADRGPLHFRPRAETSASLRRLERAGVRIGVFTDAHRRAGKRVLIAGGIGITPVRALVERSRDDVVIYRAIRDDDLVLREELDALGVDVRYVVGDHGAPGGDRLLSPAHLLELVPDLADCDVYVCQVDRQTYSAGIRRVFCVELRRPGFKSIIRSGCAGPRRPRESGSRACPWLEQGVTERSLDPGFPRPRERAVDSRI